MVLAAIGAGDQMLAAILDPAHRVSAAHREPAKAHLFGQQDALVAKAATDIGGDRPHLALVEPKALGQSGAHDVRHLARPNKP